jgi:hypothetical protein
MKRVKGIFSRVICLTVIILISASAAAQEKLTRQEKKAIEKAQMAYNFRIIDSLLMKRRFVLEADFLRDQYGNQAYVENGLNFVKVDGDKGILQTGTTSGFGYNGVGGVTAEGKVEYIKIDRNLKNLTFTVTFHIVSNLGNYDILMNVNSVNNASATISANVPGRLTWQGRLSALDHSRVFKGQTTY